MKKRKMDGQGTAKALTESPRSIVTDFGSWRARESAVPQIEEQPIEKPLSRWQRYLINLHLKEMADEPTKPYWNPQMIGTWCSVVGLIIILVSLIATGAFALGMMWEKNSTMERELQDVKKTAEKARDLNLLNQPAGGEEEK